MTWGLLKIEAVFLVLFQLELTLITKMIFWVSLILCFQDLHFENKFLLLGCNESFLNVNSIPFVHQIYCQDSINIRINDVPILKQPNYTKLLNRKRQLNEAKK